MIYIVQMGDGGSVKIGYTSSNVRARIRAIITGWPCEPRLLAVLEGDLSLESKLHKRFSRHNITREWFRPAPEILALTQPDAHQKYMQAPSHPSSKPQPSPEFQGRLTREAKRKRRRLMADAIAEGYRVCDVAAYYGVTRACAIAACKEFGINHTTEAGSRRKAWENPSTRPQRRRHQSDAISAPSAAPANGMASESSLVGSGC